MKRTKEEAEITKRKLVDAAFREFLSTGFDQSRLEDIASLAGVTRGALYWHFRNKNDLFDMLMEYKDAEAIAMCREIAESEDDPGKKLRKIISLNFPDFKNQKTESNYVRLKVEYYNYLIRTGDKRDVSGSFVNSCVEILTELKKEGRLKPKADIKRIAFTILSICSGSFVRYNSLPKESRNLKTLEKNVMDYVTLIIG